ncbi:MAG: glycosyltransferase family 4 protein [Cytophagaceae bacterium]|jgi:glycosyltransferase involved in cell wall biosynthesis|nr:glycosyltransferase family 4 protein [Cytophagaceae bacterium]
MKVLLLTDQNIESDRTFVIGGWIQSFINALKDSRTLQPGVVGTAQNRSSKKTVDHVTFYMVGDHAGNPVKRIIDRWRCKIEDRRVIAGYVDAMHDFQPDIIHIFGVESFVCRVIPFAQCKVVVHLQGILNPCLNAWFPPAVSKKLSVLKSFRLFDSVRGITLGRAYRRFAKIAAREQEYFKNIRFAMGRTHWDKTITLNFMNGVHYFHVEELLRSEFFAAQQWQLLKNDSTFRILSILSPNLYKGFDTVLKTAALLVRLNIKFDWHICGAAASDKAVKTIERTVKSRFKESSVYFHGKKNATEVVEMMHQSNLYVHPSYIENSANSVCEAQLLGMPVVATNVGGTASIIENGKTGILVPANDPYYLAGVINSLMQNPETAAALGAKARVAALRRHDRNTVIQNVEAVYSEIYSSKVQD